MQQSLKNGARTTKLVDAGECGGSDIGGADKATLSLPVQFESDAGSFARSMLFQLSSDVFRERRFRAEPKGDKR
jgi:hypothetical protein